MPARPAPSNETRDARDLRFAPAFHGIPRGGFTPELRVLIVKREERSRSSRAANRFLGGFKEPTGSAGNARAFRLTRGD